MRTFWLIYIVIYVIVQVYNGITNSSTISPQIGSSVHTFVNIDSVVTIKNNAVLITRPYRIILDNLNNNNNYNITGE